eukprot:12212122-Heterocapsa_arctica.AAC.1
MVYMFYQDYGNQHYAMWLDSTKSMTECQGLAQKTRGDIVEAVMGLGWIYNKNRYEELEDILAIMCEIEKGLRLGDPVQMKRTESK